MTSPAYQWPYPPRIVRRQAVLDYAEHERLGPTGVQVLMDRIMADALAIVHQQGYTRPVVRTTNWDLHVVCGFTDYPMYLLGPNAPRIETAADVFEHVWHLENPLAQYTVVIEDDPDDQLGLPPITPWPPSAT